MKRGIAAVLSVGLLFFSLARGQTVPIWKVDSTVDKMTDKRVIWAELVARRPLSYRWGTFRPSLTVICFTGSEWDDGLHWRFESQVSPTFSFSGGDKGARMTLRYDTTKAEDFRFTVQDFGAGSFMTPEHSYRWDGDIKTFSNFSNERQQLRDEFVRRMLDAHRLLVQYTLITDETVVAEFTFGPQTRRAVQRVFGACGQQPPS